MAVATAHANQDVAAKGKPSLTSTCGAPSGLEALLDLEAGALIALALALGGLLSHTF